MQQSTPRARYFLTGMVLILALAAGGFTTRAPASAQYYAEFDGAPYEQLPGVQEAIHRHYQNTITAQLNIYVTVVRFDSEANAIVGLDTLNAYYLEAFANAASPMTFEPADAPPIGTDTRAYHAILEVTPNPYGEATLVQALDGVYVYEVLAINYKYGVERVETSPTIAMDMVEALFTRPAATGTPAPTDDGPAPSGTWEKLPEVGDEVPERYGILNASDTLWFEPEVATPEVLDTPYGNDGDVAAIVGRTYATLDSETGERSEEGLGAYVQIAAFNDPAAAEAGFASIQTSMVDLLALDGLNLEATGADLSADGVAAYTGVVDIDNEPFSASLVCAWSGTHVVMVLVGDFGDSGSTLGFAMELAQSIVSAEAGSGPEQFSDDGSSTGGTWDMLPSSGDDVLDGLEPIEDEELHP